MSEVFAGTRQTAAQALGPSYVPEAGPEMVQTFNDARRHGQKVFYTKSRNYLLIRVGRVSVPNMLGQIADVTPGGKRVVYQFDSNGTLVVSPGQDVLPDGPGQREQDAIEWLRSHPRFNRRFFEQGNEPGRPQPTDEDFTRLVTDAVIARDVERLRELEERELATHNRPNLLDHVQHAIDSIQEQPVVEGEAWEPPEGYDRAEVVKWLAEECDVKDADKMTDRQLVDLTRDILKREPDGDA